MPPAPAAFARLFPDLPPETALLRDHRDFLIGRLLEEGDSSDLAWLVGEVGEAALADWVRRRGARQLSRRSRVFWEGVLGVEAGPAVEREAPWPL